MKEDKPQEKKIYDETIKREKKLITEILKTKAKELTACKGCKRREAAARGVVHKAAVVAGTTILGLGVGVTIGIGALAAAAVAEVTIPAILTFKALGVTGGALGFLKGAKNAGRPHGPSKTAKDEDGEPELIKDTKKRI